MTRAASPQIEGRTWLDGGTELWCARAVSVILDAGRKLRVIATLHVHDGLFLGTRSAAIYQRGKQLIKTKLDIKVT